jgi:hypothetical protein
MTPDKKSSEAILEKKLIELSFSETVHMLIVIKTKKNKDWSVLMNSLIRSIKDEEVKEVKTNLSSISDIADALCTSEIKDLEILN